MVRNSIRASDRSRANLTQDFFDRVPEILRNFVLGQLDWSLSLASTTRKQLGKDFMAIVDSKGRLFGKISILDIGAALVILLVIVGIFFFPGTSGSVAQLGTATKPVEVDVVVRSIGADNPETVLKPGNKANLIIRNQPYGEIKIASVRELPRNVVVPQPDGGVKALPDPRPEASLTKDYFVTVTGNARITKDGPVLGNNKIKIGTRIELEGLTYDFAELYVMDVRIKD